MQLLLYHNIMLWLMVPPARTEYRVELQWLQMQVIYSSYMQGAAILAGGPYDCAQGSLAIGGTSCLHDEPPIDVGHLASVTVSRAADGLIDPVYHMSDHKLFLFSGTLDSVVNPKVMQACYDYELQFVPSANIQWVHDLPAEHTIPTDDPTSPNACDVSRKPWISYCNYDSSGLSLQQIYGPLNARNKGTLGGKLFTFDQTQFHKSPSSISMADEGFIFVPQSCADLERCVLLVAFHGCLDNEDSVGQWFVNGTGLNNWADTNNIIILYPQTVASLVYPDNPEGCWDWWGYNDPLAPITYYYDTNQGAQSMMIRDMMDWIGRGYIP